MPDHSLAQRVAVATFAVVAIGAGATAAYSASSRSHDPEAETAS